MVIHYRFLLDEIERDVSHKKNRKNTSRTHYYYLQVITFQNEDLQYQDIVTKFSKNLSELDNIIEDMRKYNNNKNTQLININK